MQKSGKFYKKLGIPEGTSFPTATYTEDGDLFYRTDLEDAYILKNGTWTSITLGGAGSGVSNFIALTDTPTTYSGYSGYTVTVKNDESGLEFSPYIAASGSGAVYKILLYSNNVTEYAATDAGMALAIAAATTGDTIKIPPMSLSNTYTIPSGVTIAGESISDCVFNNQVTLNTDSTLEHVTVTINTSDADFLFGVLGPNIGSGYIKYCWISCINTLGSGYGVGARNGTLHIYGGRVYGSTADVIESWSE